MTDKPTQYHSYKDLQVWSKSVEFSGQVIKNLQALKSQDRQIIGETLFTSAVAVPALIANGYASRSKSSYVENLKSALAQVAVIESIMESCITADISLEIDSEMIKLIRIMLAKLTSSITAKDRDQKTETKTTLPPNQKE